MPAVDLERQLLPGTFEHALSYPVDHELDLPSFDVRYKNGFTGGRDGQRNGHPEHANGYVPSSIRMGEADEIGMAWPVGAAAARSRARRDPLALLDDDASFIGVG